MKSEEFVGNRVVRTSGTVASALEPRSRTRVANVLDRLVASPVLPVSVKVGDQEVETRQYIARLADVARVP